MVFISYSWDSEEHAEKVGRLVKLLKKSGIQVIWDRELTLGKRIPSFMEESLRECSRVLFICTPNYKAKADGRDGGVGYETNVITGDVYRSHNDLKYIPVLFEGGWDASMPLWASGKLGADLREENIREYEKLLDALADEKDPLPAPAPRRAAEEEPQADRLPAAEPAGQEERRALERIYRELLDVKAWLAGLEFREDGGLEDPGGAEHAIWKKVRTLQKMRDTYDFILKKNIIDGLNEFFRWWRSFEYYYVHLEEETLREAGKTRGLWASLFYVSPAAKLKNSYSYTKDACGKALIAVSRRLG